MPDAGAASPPRRSESTGGAAAGGPDGRAAFAVRLSALFAAAGGPPVKSVIRAANTRLRPNCTPITAQRISDWRRGNRTPAAFESVVPVLEVLIREVRTRPPDSRIDSALLDMRRWRADWQTARSEHAIVSVRTRAPYRGLRSYRPEHADLFFGRDAARQRLRDLVLAAESGPEPALVVLLGGREVGKSSLLSAGLQADPGPRVPVRVTPRDDLAGALAAAPPGHRLLLVDQGERLFTRCTPDAAGRFLSQLAELAAPHTDPRMTVVFACDSAYLNELTAHPAFAAALRNPSMLVEPMTEQELREAITRPAAAVGLKVEDRLVEVLVQDLAAFEPHSPVRLPMLSYLLTATWENRRGNTLTLDSYRESGGVKGAFAKGCEAQWDRISERHRAAARHVLVALTFIGPTGAQRDRISPEVLIQESEDPEATAAVIDWLTKVRVLVPHKGQVELVHDLMLTVWPRMTEWLAEEREFAAVRPRIEADAREWARRGRPPNLLYRRTRLREASDWLRRTGTPNRLAREFLSESTVRHRHRMLRLRLVQIAIAVLAALALILATALFIEHTSPDHSHTGWELRLAMSLGVEQDCAPLSRPAR